MFAVGKGFRVQGLGLPSSTFGRRIVCVYTDLNLFMHIYRFIYIYIYYFSIYTKLRN